MAWSDADGWLTRGLGPSVSTIVITLLVALSLPVLLHLYIYRSKAPASPPSFLLAGPSGAGKTALLTLFERGSPSPTHVSQTPLGVDVALPPGARAGSDRYRSEHDVEATARTRLRLVDTPGHGKLRHFALRQLAAPQGPRGVVFVVDAARLAADAGLAEAAEYLHDVLLALQRRYAAAGTAAAPEAAVLVAANKLDLFTALPAPLVRAALESEITKVRHARSKGLLAAGVGEEDAGGERDWLGDGGEGSFEFRQMEAANVHVDVVGGSVLGAQGADVGGWWEWIAGQL